ncbi:hypothetical protein OL239_07200 [Arthrobacter sp. ATA002]|uniref:heparinase II/III family protein n=1 Tax=Arthrobacter sp. ATA002 TaxID=2991715 RepID=UPI0022A74212|nr:heparinase II/III family protein [Arthrobacter sp. ATA002]WAP52915.1 hypothetical protein OL239_07200 [Arthrobacter sp. ATA002]
MLNSERSLRLREIALSQLPASSSSEAQARASKFLDQELISSVQFGDQPFNGGRVWSASTTRANERYLHGFLFFIDWSKTLLAQGNPRCEEGAGAALAIIGRWADLHPSREPSSNMAYHDETTAQRLINLISIYPALVRTLGEQATAPVQALMESTAAVLARDDFHAGNNNHGMFQDLSLLYYSLLCATDPGVMQKYYELSLRRLRNYFSTCYTSDGVHVENTPTYHLLVSRQLANVHKLVEAADHEDADYYGQLVQNAETYAAHALMPDGKYPPISDTQQVDTSKSGMAKVFPGSAFQYASTCGRKGVAPQARVLVLPDSGYAIYRSSWGDPDAVYAFFQPLTMPIITSTQMI